MNSFDEIYFWIANDDDTRERLRDGVKNNPRGRMLDETTAGFREGSNFKDTLQLHEQNLTRAGRCVTMPNESIIVESLV